MSRGGNMEKLFESITNIFFVKKENNSIRYPLIVIILSVFVIATFCLFAQGVILFDSNIILSLIFFSLGFILFLGSIIKVKNIYFLKNNVK